MILGKRIYLDFASGTPFDGEILKLVKKMETRIWSNPSSLHFEGQLAREVLEESRKRVSEILHIKPEEVIFTSGGTESNNLAILGVVNYYSKKIWGAPEIISSPIEHPSVLEAASKVAKINYVELNKFGQVEAKSLIQKLNDQTVLISLAMANGELGTIENLRELKNQIDEWKISRGKSKYDPPFLHTDATQAAICLNISFDFTSVDLMTLDGSKIYGPKGTGCLAKKRYVEIEPILLGGKQENGLRAGTENVPAFYGFSLALNKVSLKKDENYIKFRELNKKFLELIKKYLPEVKENVPETKRLPNIINLCFPQVNSEYATVVLDENGLACSYSTACANLSDSTDPKSILAVLGQECGSSSLRFSLGLNSSFSDIKKAVEIIKKSKQNMVLSSPLNVFKNEEK